MSIPMALDTEFFYIVWGIGTTLGNWKNMMHAFSQFPTKTSIADFA